MKILITGGCGFVGSNLAIIFKSKYPDYHIIAFDNLKRRGSELNIQRLKERNIEFIHGDIRNPEDFDSIGELNSIIDCSAEPSVLAGLNNTPNQTININLVGTINILNLAIKKKASFLFLSTSRVYPIKFLNEIKYHEDTTRFQISPEQVISGLSPKGISERFPIDGFRSLYGASKLSSEIIIQEYIEFFNLKAVINRCGVIAGPNQMGKVDQGVTVLWVARHFWKKPLGYFGFGGQGKQVRDVIHIEDLVKLIDIQIHNMVEYNSKTFNVGGGNDVSFSLCELTEHCAEVTGNKIKIDSVPETRVADIPIYITDNSLIESTVNWKVERSVKDIVSDIFTWIQKNEKLLKPILN